MLSRVRVRYYALPWPATRRGFSEHVIRRRLERRGWQVWRPDLLCAQHEYLVVRRKYGRLVALLDRFHPGLHEELRYLCAVHHGLPDFLCFHGSFLFVECKLGYEPLSWRQRQCFRKLLRLGFRVEVHVVAGQRQRSSLAELDLVSGEKIVVERQCSLARF